MADSPTRDELGTILVQLRRKVDTHFDAAVARTPQAFRCSAGCDACCHVRIGVFAVEAAPIREALARLAVDDPGLRAEVRAQADDPAHQHHCALLVRGQCAVYEQRPLICRSHGLPVLASEPGAEASAPLQLDHCPLNFTDEPPPRASMLRLDAVNQPLAMLAGLWTATDDAGRSPAGTSVQTDRVALEDLARAADGPAKAPRSRPFRRP